MIEAAGTESALSGACDVVRPGGTVLVLGVHWGDDEHPRDGGRVKGTACAVVDVLRPSRARPGLRRRGLDSGERPGDRGCPDHPSLPARRCRGSVQGRSRQEVGRDQSRPRTLIGRRRTWHLATATAPRGWVLSPHGCPGMARRSEPHERIHAPRPRRRNEATQAGRPRPGCRAGNADPAPPQRYSQPSNVWVRYGTYSEKSVRSQNIT